MLQRSNFTQERWNQFVVELDERIHAAVTGLIKSRGPIGSDLAPALNELTKFRTRGGEDSDYSVTGIGAAHLL